MQTLDDLLAAGVAGRTVLVRSDLNVPLDGSVITDDGRIKASLPTLQALILGGAKVVVTAHLGRPKGAPEAKYSLAPAADRLGELLGSTVPLATDLVGPSARQTVAALAPGGIAMLENVRFDARETSKDAAERAALADDLVAVVGEGAAFVSDGFGVVHRKQASVYEIAAKLPHYAGYLVSAETAVLKKLTVDPDRPYAVILGGSKVSDKLGVITSLLPRVDSLLIGGGMAFTFLAAQGHGVGASLLQEDQIEICKNLLAENGDKIVLPTDVVIADAFSADAAIQIVERGRHSGRLAGPGHRPGERGSVLRDRGEVGHRVLERADGRLRAQPVRGRHPGGRRGDLRVTVVLRGRRRRLRRGGPHSRRRRIRLHPHLDRRWRVPGVPRGQRAPRPGSTGGMSMARKPLIAGNWKMNLNHLEGIALVQKIAFTLPDKYLKHVEVAVIPAVHRAALGADADRGRQARAWPTARRTCPPHDSGAYTGEISGSMLAKLGCTYVLVGHSERREYHNESDELLAKKVNAAYRHGLIPLLCFGEGLEVREAGNQVQHSVDQMLAAMVDVTPEQAASIVLAYEPVWAIGTGRVATPADAQEVCGAARAALAEKYGAEIADGIRILYGGSVKSAQRLGDHRAGRRRRRAGRRGVAGRHRVRQPGRERRRRPALAAPRSASAPIKVAGADERRGSGTGVTRVADLSRAANLIGAAMGVAGRRRDRTVRSVGLDSMPTLVEPATRLRRPQMTPTTDDRARQT